MGENKLATTDRHEPLSRWAGGDYLNRLQSDLLRPVSWDRRPWPSYAFVPGRNPHPRRNKDGHSYGKPEASASDLDPKNWQGHPLWSEGLDLYNHGYFWEAHEALEALWHGMERKGPVADLLRALIKACAAHLKAFDHQMIGPRTLARRCTEEIEGLLEQSEKLTGTVWSFAFENELRGFCKEHRKWFDALLNNDPVLPPFPFLRLLEST